MVNEFLFGCQLLYTIITTKKKNKKTVLRIEGLGDIRIEEFGGFSIGSGTTRSNGLVSISGILY